MTRVSLLIVSIGLAAALIADAIHKIVLSLPA